MVYAEDELLDVIDYRGPQSVHGGKSSSANCKWSAGIGTEAAVQHSGDVMCSSGGRHAINVSLDKLPDKVTDCFFALSAYHCRNLARFKLPSVRFFDVEFR